MNWAAVAAAVGFLILLMVVGHVRERRRQRRMAKNRERWTQDQLLASFKERGIKADTAQFVATQIQPYYFAPLTPQPDDDLIGAMKIDPEDFADGASEYAKQFGFNWPSGVGSDWPDPLTPASFGLWLDSLRAAAADHRPR